MAAYASPKWTYVLIAACITAFLFQTISDAWIYLAFVPALVPRMPWTLVTSLFLHASLSHLFFNMFALLFFGTYLERMVGRSQFLAVFILSGVVGNVGHMLTASNPFVPTIGASGAVYGVIGALAVLAPFLLVFIPGMFPVPLIAAALLWGLLDFAGLFTPSGIARGAHLAGMFIGASFGLYVRATIKKREW
ncbi:MAG: rhomboid family intramembrane serine protease [Candidatus Bathyarchaeia archaeon]